MIVSRRYYDSSSFKMATLFTILLGLSAILLSYFLYSFGNENFIRETEAAINSDIENILLSLPDTDSSSVATYITKRAQTTQSNAYLYQSPSGDILAGSFTMIPDELDLIKEGVLRFSLNIDSVPHTFAAKIHTFPDGSRLLVGRDIHFILKSYDKFGFFSIIILIFMLLVVLISFFISTFVVRRINLIAKTAEGIMDTGDLSQRISIRGNWDDLSNLAQVLNALLERVESLVHGIKDVSNNIAHDLRTPLTRLRNQLEANPDKPISPKEKEKLLQEADQLLAIFSSLLRISHIEKGSVNQDFKPHNLSLIINDVLDLYEPLTEDRNISLSSHIDDTLLVHGDSNLLFQLFLNLIDNAIKYSSHQVNITSSIDKKASVVNITINDDGIGLDPAEYEKVFERFYRSEQSRSTSGHGLGLSMVKAVLELHNGIITFADNKPGLSVTVELPLTS